MAQQSRDVGFDQCHASARIVREGGVSVYSRPAYYLASLPTFLQCKSLATMAAGQLHQSSRRRRHYRRRQARKSKLADYCPEIHDVGQPHIKWHRRLSGVTSWPHTDHAERTERVLNGTLPRVRPRPPFWPCTRKHPVCASQSISARAKRHHIHFCTVSRVSNLPIWKTRQLFHLRCREVHHRSFSSKTRPTLCASQNENQLLQLLIRQLFRSELCNDLHLPTLAGGLPHCFFATCRLVFHAYARQTTSFA